MNDLRLRLSSIEGAYKSALAAIKATAGIVEQLEGQKQVITDAQSLTKAAITETVDLRAYIEKLVSSTLHSIFGSEYSFILKPKEKDGMIVGLIPIIKENEHELNIKVVGGGMKGVCSTVIRMIFLLFTKEQTKVQILDEQLVNLSEDKFNIFLQMIRDLQQSLDYQLIAITHSDATFDSSINLVRKGGYTTVS